MLIFLIKVLSRPLDEEDLISIKKMLLAYFADKLTAQADQVHTPEKEKEWLEGHFRTPYKK